MDTFLGSIVQSCCAEGGTLQTNNTGMCSQCLGHTGFAPTHSVCAFPVLHCLGSRLLCQELSEAGPGLYALPKSKPSGSGIQIVLRGVDLVVPAFCALPRSEQLR